MKKILLCLFIVKLSLFPQVYLEKLYDAIENNNTREIQNIVISYNVNLNNIYLNRESSFASVYGDSYYTYTPLNWAILCKNINSIDILLKLGADLEIETEYDYYTYHFSMRPLMLAVNLSNSQNIISFLIKKGANINAQNDEGKTALMYSCCTETEHKSFTDYTKILINSGADINIKDNEERTALMYAAYSHSSTSVDLLIKNKADINAMDIYGSTPLMYACFNSNKDSFGTLNPDVVKLLIKYGSDVNAYDNYGNTALLYAVMMARDTLYQVKDENNKDYKNIYDTIKFLIDNGADVNVKNNRGETPLSISSGNITDLLMESGAYLNNYM